MAKAKKSGEAKGSSTKRMAKVLSNSIRGVTAGSIRRLSRRAGIKRLSGTLYEEVRTVLKTFVEGVVRDATAHTEHRRSTTCSTNDVISALKKRGRVLYGY